MLNKNFILKKYCFLGSTEYKLIEIFSLQKAYFEISLFFMEILKKK